MKKLLISLSTLIPIFSATSILAAAQKVNNLSTENFQQIQKNIDLVSNSDDFSTTDEDDYYTLEGQNYNTTYRVFISSNKDTSLPNIENSVTYALGKKSKDTWYDYQIKGLSLDITTLAANKDEFLKKYRAVTVSFLYMSNFWNDLHKWRYPGGKLSPYNVEAYTFNLTAENHKDTVYTNSAPTHSNNEKTHLIIDQTWDGNILNINYWLGTWYHWKAGSIYNHGALAQFTNDKYTLIAVPAYDPNIQNVHIDRAERSNKINLKSANKVTDFDLVNQDLKAKAASEAIGNAWFKTATIFLASFYWISGNKGYGVTIRFLGDTAINFASFLLLNGALFDRTLTFDRSNNLLKAVYTDDFANKIITDLTSFDFNDKITYQDSKIVVPFIYIN